MTRTSRKRRKRAKGWCQEEVTWFFNLMEGTTDKHKHWGTVEEQRPSLEEEVMGLIMLGLQWFVQKV
jgi:hypothetical protein